MTSTTLVVAALALVVPASAFSKRGVTQAAPVLCDDLSSPNGCVSCDICLTFYLQSVHRAATRTRTIGTATNINTPACRSSSVGWFTDWNIHKGSFANSGCGDDAGLHPGIEDDIAHAANPKSARIRVRSVHVV